MKVSNFSNVHGVATVRGWTKGGSSTGGGVVVTDGIVTVSPATTVSVPTVTDGGGGTAVVLPQIIGPWSASGGVLDFSSGHPKLLYPDEITPTDGLDLFPGSVQLFSVHTPGDLTDLGLVFEAGDDFVGIRLSEKDSSTVQIYADVSGGYDIELKDRGGKNWKSVGAQYTTPLEGIPHLYRLPFAWNTASISTGVAIGTVKSSDVILGAWIDVSTAWNSVTSDSGDIVTGTTGDSLLQATVNMKTAPSGTDRRKLRNGGNAYGDASVMLSDQTINVKVTSVGGSLSAGAATAFVLVVRYYA